MKCSCILLLAALCAKAQTSNEALAQRAVEAERQGNFHEAIEAFQQLIQNGTDGPELRSNLGIAYYQSGDSLSALREFRTALSKAPESTTANLFCGLSLLKLQRPKEAVAYLAKADRKQPNNVITLSAMAQADVAMNEIAAANGIYRRVTALDARNAQAWYGLGITDRLLAEQSLKAGRPNAASGAASNLQRSRSLMDDFQKSIGIAGQLDPGSVSASMIFGESFRIAEKYDEAIREYRTATEQAPQLAAAWSGLAAAQSASGDDESAVKSATRARELDPADADTNTLLAAIYVRMGDLGKAEPLIREALRGKPDLSSARLVLAKLYLSAHQPQKALPEVQAATRDDLDGSTHYLLATTLRQLGRPAEAAAAMQEYERLHKQHVGSAVK